MRLTIALLLLTLPPAMTGCAVFEALGGMPYAEKTVTLPQAVSGATALNCAFRGQVSCKIRG